MGAIPFKPLLVRPRLIIITRPSQLHFIFESGESVWWFWLNLMILVNLSKRGRTNMWKYSASAEAAKMDQKVMNGDVLCQSIHDFDWRWNFQHCSKLNDSTTKNYWMFGVVLISGWNSLLSITLNGLNWSIFRSWSLFFGASFQWEGQLVGGGLPYPGNPGKWFCLQSLIFTQCPVISFP